MLSKMRIACAIVSGALLSLSAGAEVYSWKDANGKIHFGDRKPIDHAAKVINTKNRNIASFEKPTEQRKVRSRSAQSEPDNLRMPRSKSDVPFRFVLTSRINNNVPGDRLESIRIGLKQKSLHGYVKLTGIEKGKLYKMRLRVLDAKRELIFDATNSQTSSTNSLWFAATVSPTASLDAPGDWTFQGILNGEFLYEEKRRVWW